MERTGSHARLITFAASIAVVAVLYLAKVVLIPLALAMLVSFLLAPLVLRLQRWHCSRVVAVLAAVLLVFVAASATSWLVVGQVREVTTNLSEYRENLRDKVSTLRGALARPVQSVLRAVEDLGTDRATAGEPERADVALPTVRIAEPARGPFEVLRDALGPALGAMTTAAMALVIAFVMLLRRDDLGDRLMRVLGPGQVLVTTRALEDATAKVSRYLRRLLLLNGTHGLAVGVGLACIGVPHAILWGFVSATLRFIPYLGPWIAAAFPVLAALAGSPGWSQPLLTIGLFATLELVSNNLLEPWLYGTGTGLSPLAILVSALFWTWLWGPVGLLLSTPLTVCLVVMGKHVPQLQFLHQLFGDAPGLSPPARLYQRMIAGDQDQAWLVLRPEIERKALHEVYDDVVLPALSMAEQDRQRGALDESAEARIVETIERLLEEARERCALPVASSDPAPAPARAEPVRVLCLPARGTADVLAASMLRQVLEREGVQVEVSPTAELSGETLEVLARHRVDAVCISVVPPSGFMHVRYLCKRISGRYPRLPIFAGLWTLDLEAPELADRIPILAGVHVVTTLGAARIQVRQLAESARVEREAGAAAAAIGAHDPPTVTTPLLRFEVAGGQKPDAALH